MPKHAAKMLICVAVLACAETMSAGEIDYIDWSTVTLEGSNPYTFTDPTLGEVTLTYSGNFQLAGVTDLFGGLPLLGLGELNGSNGAILTIGWETPIRSMNVRAYDLDLSESDTFTFPGCEIIRLASEDPPSGNLIGNRLQGPGADLPNGDPDNFQEAVVIGRSLTSFSVTFTRPGPGSGGHAINFGVSSQIPPQPCADLNFDGLVNLADLNILLGAFGNDDCGDVNGDGVTDLVDLNLVLADFGGPCSE